MSIMSRFYNLKFAGLIDPEGDEEVDILTMRKAKYLRFTERMVNYPPKMRPVEHDPMPTDKDHTIIHAVKNGLIPWPFNNETPDEYIQKWKEKNKEAHESDNLPKVKSRPWGDYFYTCFFGLAGRLILMDENTIMKKREQLYQPVDTSHLPQDGSKGQAKTSRSNRRYTVDWFIGQWDGHYTDWEESTTPSEMFK